MAVTALFSGCSFAPTYQVPPTAIPTAFKEGGAWQLAKPADQGPRDAWWQVYHDPVLDKLEVQVAAANPDVAATAQNPVDADSAVALQTVQRKDVEHAAPVKGTAAKDSSTSAAKVVAAAPGTAASIGAP